MIVYANIIKQLIKQMSIDYDFQAVDTQIASVLETGDTAVSEAAQIKTAYRLLCKRQINIRSATVWVLDVWNLMHPCIDEELVTQQKAERQYQIQLRQLLRKIVRFWLQLMTIYLKRRVKR